MGEPATAPVVAIFGLYGDDDACHDRAQEDDTTAGKPLPIRGKNPHDTGNGQDHDPSRDDCLTENGHSVGYLCRS